MSDVTTKVAKKLPPPKAQTAPLATPAPDSVGTGLLDRLKDPLQAKSSDPVAALAGKDVAPPQPTAAAGIGEMIGKPLQTKTPALSEGKLPGGQKVLRTLFLNEVRKIPWGQVGYLMGLPDGIPSGARAQVDAALAGLQLDQPYVELIDDGGDLALQIEDREMIVGGPYTLVSGYKAQMSASADASDAGQAANHAGGRVVERLENTVHAAKQRRDAMVGDEMSLGETRRIEQTDLDASARRADAAKAGSTKAAGGGRTIASLRAARDQLAGEVEQLERQAKAAGSDASAAEAKSHAARARALLSELDAIVNDMTAVVAKIGEHAGELRKKKEAVDPGPSAPEIDG